MKTKTKTDRLVPMSSRLRAVLEMRKTGPDGRDLPRDAYVFGNEVGEQVKDIKRAWNVAVLKAHGCKPSYTANKALVPESLRELETIDLHFHDLRREAGSAAGSMAVYRCITIRDWLGHTNIAQTSTYLAGTAATQHDAPMTRFEAHQAPRIATGVETGVQTGASSTGQHGRKHSIKPRSAAKQPSC